MMQQRTVKCVKLNKELPGLQKPPFPGELGQKVYENVSQEAWKMFLEYFKIIVNEFRLDLTKPETDKVFYKQVNDYFFGKGGKLPEQYVEPKQKE